MLSRCNASCVMSGNERAMIGVKYLLDTNFVLGLLKSAPDIVEMATLRNMQAHECAYSAVTRMELLGFAGITANEDAVIRFRLAHFVYLPITREIEDQAIALRRQRRIKLPDALIAATALHNGLELLTFDAGLLSVMRGWHAY